MPHGDQQKKVDATLSRLRALPIIHDGLARLKSDLPKNLLYHAYEHTEDVLAEAILFAVVDNLSKRQIELLGIAAVYHDFGFIHRQSKNEPIGAEAAVEVMRLVGSYSESEIATVRQMILDTALVDGPTGPHQIANCKLSEYLLDADLSNFGRSDFFDKGELQRREAGEELTTFRKQSLALLTTHSWLTPAAYTLRQKKKEENRAALEKLVA